MKRLKKFGLGLLGTVGAGWVLVQNRMLTTDEYEVRVPGLPAGMVGKRILHLSDLHKKRYGEGFNNLINSCMFLEPDLIFFTGDLFSRTETNLAPKLVLMERLMRIAPVYYVPGNHESDVPMREEVLCTALKKLGVHVLQNSTEQFVSDLDHINITGVELPLSHYHSGKNGKRRPVTPQMLRKLVGKPEQGEVNVLLSHDPLAFEAYAEWGADLTFSGHVHGGIIRLPVVGGLLSPERRFFPKYTKGVYSLGSRQMVVSAGLGKFRLMNPSQIILVKLKSS